MDVTPPVTIEESIRSEAFEAVDLVFSDAVRSAGYSKKPDALMALLNDPSFVLGMGERELLSQLVGGEIRKRKGSPAGGSVGFSGQRAAATEYLNRTDAGEQAESVASEICARSHINKDRTTLLGWVAEMRELENNMAVMQFDWGKRMWPGRSIFLSD